MTTITTDPKLSYDVQEVLVISGKVRLSCFEFGGKIPGGVNNMVAQFSSNAVRHNFMLALDSPSLKVEKK